MTQGSRVNGPGSRSVLHLQGCTLGCPACFNPETHDPAGGSARPSDEVAAELLSSDPDGVTISGGEPFQQPRALAALLRRLRESGTESILIFSGYTINELAAIPGAGAVLARTDVLVAGRYTAAAHDPSPTLMSSANQRIHFLTERHGPGDVELAGGDVEVTIRPDGSVHVTGFPPPALRRAVRNLGD